MFDINDLFSEFNDNPDEIFRPGTSRHPSGFDPSDPVITAIRDAANRIWNKIRAGLLQSRPYLVGGGFIQHCKRCDEYVGGDFMVDQNGICDAVRRCSCGKRVRVNVAKEYCLEGIGVAS